MASQDAPLDELVWHSIEWAQQMGGIHENTSIDAELSLGPGHG